ncbi:MAG: ATP-binding cassette domain-containing protein [Puniceicoccales bacterium]|jgi:putative ABC transport system ATP-binding protein|nr:ATP-binding cassette domain-containing protein [Puniceicoccales bacterium]
MHATFPVNTPAIGARQPVISARGLNHWFDEGDGRRQVLHNITTDVFLGEIVLIVGPSGSGKSTLLKLFGAQRAVLDGSLRVNGGELRDARPKDLVRVRRGIGFIFQSHHLLKSLSICQNVQMPLTNSPGHNAASSRKAALEILARVGLHEHASKRPAHLSGGQNQRVAIARALVNRPQIVLADEPTASLDKTTGHEVAELLRRLARDDNVAIVLVTHDNRIMDIADRILELDDGHLQECPR